jgi:hypothetical protein
MNSVFTFEAETLATDLEDLGLELPLDELTSETPNLGTEEGEFSFLDFPDSVLRVLRSGLESVGLRLAVAFGYRDENKLANLVFFVRHPERGGRAIAKGEPNFTQLSREWIEIRDQLVRPLLSPATTPTPSPGPTPAPAVPSGPVASPPPTEGPYSGITGTVCASGRGKCWSGAKSRDVVDSDAPWNNEFNRSAANYAAVLDYFNVGTCQDKDSCLRVENPRYRRTATSTYCNIYVHDVTRALWASIPHWVRNPSQRQPPVGWNELNANATVAWMLKNSRAAGWVALDPPFCQSLFDAVLAARRPAFPDLSQAIAATVARIASDYHEDINLLKQPSYVAQQFANAGLPSVIVWKNPTAGKPGHVAMVRPETASLRGQTHSRGVFVPRSAQAGGRNFANDLASWIVTARTALFYVHA